MNLECSSKGDKRFSALYAKVFFNGKFDSIENHYQNCKRKYNNKQVKKGEKPDYIIICNHKLSINYLSPFYKYLWFIYLEKNKELVNYASSFDGFTDKFKGKKTINSQADVIREYLQNKEKLLNDINTIMPYINGKLIE